MCPRSNDKQPEVAGVPILAPVQLVAMGHSQRGLTQIQYLPSTQLQFLESLIIMNLEISILDRHSRK